MPSRIACACAAALAVSLVVSTAPLPAQSTGAAWAEVVRILQTPEVPTGGYHRLDFPRRDVTLRMGDVTVATALALGGWAGFSGEPNATMLMGDLVVTQDELKPALAELARQRLNVTSLHNHLSGESPTMTYIHIDGEGDAIDLARRLDRAVAVTGAPRPVATAAAVQLTIAAAPVFRTLGMSGRASGNVAQLSFMLVPGTVTMHGQPLMPALAYGSPVNIQMVDASRAMATGDFSVGEAHVEPVVRALAARGITATSVHSHLVGETPRVYYIHSWADGPLPGMLRGLRGAVDAAR